jgi:hypothetical protein
VNGATIARWVRRSPSATTNVSKTLDDQLRAIEAAWPAGRPAGDGQAQFDTYIALREKRTRWQVRREIAEHVLFLIERVTILAAIVATLLGFGH